MTEQNHQREDRLNARATFWKRIAIGGVAALLLTSSVASAYGVYLIRQTQTTGSPVVLRLTDIAEDIQSCTDPDGACYQRGQKQTAKAIVGINDGTLRVVVAALSCQADGITDRAELARCTIERSQP